MDHDGSFSCARQRQLPAKNNVLHLAWRKVVVVIEADFTPGDHARVLGKRFKRCQVRVGYLRGFVRMDANRGLNPIMLLGERQRRIQFFGTRARSDREQGGDSRLARALEHGIAIFVKLREIQVRVGIYEFHGITVRLRPKRSMRLETPDCATSVACPRVHPPEIPRAPAVFRLDEAATIMPFDSTPRNFRGARFTTTTTLRPTSFSGS